MENTVPSSKTTENNHDQRDTSASTVTSASDRSSKVLEWPKLLGIDDLDLQTEQLPPLHWLAYECPEELKVTLENTPPDITKIVNQSILVGLYKKSESSDVDSRNRLSVATSDGQDRPKNDSASQLSRLSSVANSHSDGARSPSKLSLDSSAIKKPLGWIASKTPKPGRGLKEKMKERYTFKECASCMDDILDKNLITANCQHKYCHKCFVQLVNTAMDTERLFPPRCCLEKVPLRTVLDNLSHSQRDAYKLKAEEYATPEPNRWYCPSANCGKWIPASKLKKGTSPNSKCCPYCRVAMCALCRGLTHANTDECPQDFGLEATLEEAENHGWRRCYSCRAMVELTAGCRHITCQCGAEFCYTCGVRWRTCSCTETDQQQRQAEIETRRLQRDTEAANEAAEIAAAIAQIERMVREEAAERERLEAEQRRIEEEEARDREFKRMMSIADKIRILRTALTNVNNTQLTMILTRHERVALDLHNKTMSGTADFDTGRERLITGLRANQRQRMDILAAAHQAELDELSTRHEDEEDDTFLTISRHLKNNQNRDARQKRIIDKLKAQHDAERQDMLHAHNTATADLDNNNSLELKALEAGLASSYHASREASLDMACKLSQKIVIDRSWFSVVFDKRWEMLEQYRVKLIASEVDIDELPIVETLPTELVGDVPVVAVVPPAMVSEEQPPMSPVPSVRSEDRKIVPDHDGESARGGSVKRQEEVRAKKSATKRWERQSPFAAFG
ncbi:hypothetical protein FQN55_001169 [Onygenales sp. PD_40]|nr:hypothetical protein FQN55_001169 [Onygenales sp. PD_40]